ncbi:MULTISPECIES: hypothetical protein [unclassified Haloferax]|uniref:hypothetical protein n=1 Tax=unclassified Haloferax TaxID=2625095 RepID=UPI0011C04C6E|nr:MULTISPECIES: hypothetical protein [unclassified Haloferax]
MGSWFGRKNIATWVMVLLAGIPAAAKFYPPIFVSVFATLPNAIQDVIELLPLGLLTEVFYLVGLLSVGFLIGRFTSGDDGGSKNWTTNISDITGCIKKKGVAWRCEATVSNGGFTVDIDRTPRCPKCQTEMTGKNKRNLRRTSKWSCPNSDCLHEVDYSDDIEAEKIFTRHIERILNDTEEQYFIDNIVSESDDISSGTEIWEAYVDMVGDEYSDVSTACFT